MNIKFGLAGIILALLGTTAYAETQRNSFYLGSGIGMYNVDIDGLDFDTSAPTMRLFGGYKFNEYLAFEGGFTNMFSASEDVLGVDVDMKGTSWDLSVRPTLPIGDRFEAFGVLGYSFYDWKIKATLNDVTTSANDDDSELIYGLGGAWHINNAWSLRGEFTMVDVSDADFNMFSASVKYNFQ